MPSNTHTANLATISIEESDPIESRLAFCRALKAARTRRGVSLEEIAAVTKVCVSYFDALERADLTHWPKAIFRRAFFRGYVEMIGLSVEDSIREFCRLFPDDDAATVSMPAVGAPSEPPRLELDASWHGPQTPLRTRVVASVLDIAAVLAASVIAWMIGANFAIALAVASVGYFALGRIVVCDSPAAALMRRRRPTASIGAPPSREVKPVVEVPSPVVEVSRPAVEARPKEPSRENVFEMRDRRSWTSDARRVRPRDASPRVRVRFK